MKQAASLLNLVRGVFGEFRRYNGYKELTEDLFSNLRPNPRASSLTDYIFHEVQSGRGRGRYFLPEISDRIYEQTAEGRPLEFAVIAVAHKNPRLDVCGGRVKPDLAELGFILHLDDIMNGVKEFYEPGANFTVLTEGGFYDLFNLFDIELDEIDRYERGVLEIAREVTDNSINFVPLRHIVGGDRSFINDARNIEGRLTRRDYERYIDVMGRSLTNEQIAAGRTPEETARKYVALHKAKHHSFTGSKSRVYQFLEDNLGPNYIYCSVTSSSRREVLNIDPYFKPGPLPQHGIGYLAGGSYKIKAVPVSDMQTLAQKKDLRAININGHANDKYPFGFVDFGKRR